MYKKLDRSKIFLKDLRKINFSNNHYSRYAVFLGKLLSDEQLPPEAKDHPLKGDFVGFRELHIGGDLLLVYKVTEDNLYLTRIGSHSQIFG
ncbi:MAG: type II toxin-antitoxin system YafQ family toxin [Campylobacterota bacterium]|nr:type II toxin-antitoxin system YafQ family toxin [Campylobacterota bacterium]